MPNGRSGRPAEKTGAAKTEEIELTAEQEEDLDAAWKALDEGETTENNSREGLVPGKDE